MSVGVGALCANIVVHSSVGFRPELGPGFDLLHPVWSWCDMCSGSVEADALVGSGRPEEVRHIFDSFE